MNRTGKHYLAALVWVALFGIAYVVIDAQLQPKVAQVGSGGEIVIPRSRDGHFYVAGQINGQPVTFLVDTGASAVSVKSGLAGRLGLPRGRPVAIGTAAGITQGEEVTGQTVTLGGHHGARCAYRRAGRHARRGPAGPERAPPSGGRPDGGADDPAAQTRLGKISFGSAAYRCFA